MRFGRVPPGSKAPFCADCRSADCHAVGTEASGIVWLCGSCEMLRENPDAAKATAPPGLPSTWRKRRKLQDERLF